MTEGIIEAVARALCLANGIDPDGGISQLAGDKAWHAYVMDAHAAITAYEAARGDVVVVPKEPTPAMMDAATEVTENGCFADDIYRAMIAASQGER